MKAWTKNWLKAKSLGWRMEKSGPAEDEVVGNESGAKQRFIYIAHAEKSYLATK